MLKNALTSIQHDAGKSVPARRPLLGVADIADWLNVSPGWVRDHANGRRRPMLPSLKLGKALRFREDQVEAFIESLSKWRVR
jgi:hypothetical protein